MRNKLLFCILIVLSCVGLTSIGFTSCESDTPDTVNLPGAWRDYMKPHNLAADSVIFDIKIECPGSNFFYITKTTFISNVNENDTCYNKPYYTEYIKGYYLQSAGYTRLVLKGDYYDDPYFTKLSTETSCYNYGQYIRTAECYYEEDNLTLVMTLYNNGEYETTYRLKKYEIYTCKYY